MAKSNRAALCLDYLLRELSARDVAPNNLQLTPVAGGFFASVFDNGDVDDVISERVCTGFARTPALAALKGVVERLERAAFYEGSRAGLASCQTKRSDGFAAFPFPSQTQRKPSAKSTARQHAYNEAVERYAWAKWWDQRDIGHDRFPPEVSFPRNDLCFRLLDAARRELPIDRFEIVVPHIEAAAGTGLGIIIAHLENRGTATGGAVGCLDKSVVWERAAAELFRHCLAIQRMFKLGSFGTSFYQKRLHFFGSGQGHELVAARLSYRGNQRVQLPILKFDEEVRYAHSDLVCVHRCLFDNQPPFMGGNIERLCI
jgi:hypothetical protein